MDEYTFSDLIMNPEAPGLEDLIGKEIYFNDVPIYCIKYANDDYKVGILTEIRKDYSAPFFVKTPSGCMLNYACIIPKKEEPKPKYIPFENAEEFLNAYHYSEIKNLDEIYHYLATRGIWLKDKSTEAGGYCMVTKVQDNGLVICDENISTNGITVFHNTIFWSELYESFTFLDSTPCGKLKENK